MAGESSSRRTFSSCVSTGQGFCFRKPWREGFFRCSRCFSAQLGCLWPFTRRSPKVIPVNLELYTPGLAATGSPPWAVPPALISMCREVGLEGRFSLWAGSGWLARGDLGVLSRSHLRTGWLGEAGSLRCSALCQCGPKAVWWTAVCALGGGLYREWWACVWRGDVCSSEKHHRQLTGALSLSAWLADTVFIGLLMGMQTGARPWSAVLHLRAQGPGIPTSNRALGRHMLRSQRHPDPPLGPS